MLCTNCNKNTATIHMQLIINGNLKDIHLCHECKSKFENPTLAILTENIFKGFLEQMQSKFLANPDAFNNFTVKQTLACTKCQMTYEELKSGGKLGCDTCYQTFSKEVEALLKNVQASIRHEGKIPKRLGTEIIFKRQTDDLREKLKKAIEEENFEEAARLRDEIRALEVTA